MENNEEDGTKSSVQINLQMRDILVLVAFLLGIPVGGFTLYANTTGTSSETTQAVKVQTDTLTSYLGRLNANLEQLEKAINSNTELIMSNTSENRRRMDSLYDLTMDGMQNLDGYFKGRIDQLDEN